MFFIPISDFEFSNFFTSNFEIKSDWLVISEDSGWNEGNKMVNLSNAVSSERFFKCENDETQKWSLLLLPWKMGFWVEIDIL